MVKGYLSRTRQVKEQCAKGKVRVAGKIQLQVWHTGKLGKQESQTEYIVSKGYQLFYVSILSLSFKSASIHESNMCPMTQGLMSPRLTSNCTAADDL